MRKLLDFFNKPLLKIPLVLGALTGILTFMYFLALYFLDITPLGNKKMPDFGIHMIMLVVGCWYYRKYVGKGLLHLWEGLTLCYVLNTTAAFLNGWLIYFFITYVDPAVFTNYLAEMQQLLVQGKGELVKNIGEAEYQQMLRNVMATERSQIITDELSKKTLMAVLPIIIVSMIFRRQDYGVFQGRP
ncbi:hypothetical protein HNQ92_000687 [Rhabdobacter roseus]|uniref:DUF4199 domain-containing protein n=1 Tax=Rhabdobacter roseus TaxID=1655419 RepID=A0A840TEL6_9BACT|nr:DUF4199 domain-containing protein [Rhabdobacter roseus]MBB5282566.1 hypothetical protein [Rhabdobacter roseus]